MVQHVCSIVVPYISCSEYVRKANESTPVKSTENGNSSPDSSTSQDSSPDSSPSRDHAYHAAAVAGQLAHINHLTTPPHACTYGAELLNEWCLSCLTIGLQTICTLHWLKSVDWVIAFILSAVKLTSHSLYPCNSALWTPVHVQLRPSAACNTAQLGGFTTPPRPTRRMYTTPPPCNLTHPLLPYI